MSHDNDAPLDRLPTNQPPGPGRLFFSFVASRILGYLASAIDNS